MKSKKKISPLMWTSLVALLYFILKNWGLLGQLGFSDESYSGFMTLVFGVLVAFGIIKNNQKGI